MHKMIFGCFAAGKKGASRALLLAESIRTFAGECSHLPFLLVHPLESGKFTGAQQELIDRLNVLQVPVELASDVASFPFAGKVIASTVAEAYSIRRPFFIHIKLVFKSVTVPSWLSKNLLFLEIECG